MKQLCLVVSFLLVYGVGISQNSFANISFDGPERYTPKSQLKTKSASEFRQMKEMIRAFPSRLDYRYDYMNELYNAEDWQRLTDEAISLVEFSYGNSHNWIWDKQFDAIGENSEAFLLSTIQDYILMLYVTDDPKQYPNINKICDVVLTHSPNHRDFLTYPAMTSAAVGDYDSALPYLHKAENAHREDGTVAFLLAENYQKLNNQNMALSYYKKALRYGSDREKLLAQREIEKITDTE